MMQTSVDGKENLINLFKRLCIQNMPDNSETTMTVDDDHNNTQDIILKHVDYTLAVRK